RMQGEAERASVPERVHLGLVSLPAHERVVVRNAAIVLEAEHLATLRLRVLRISAGRRDEERAVLRKRNPRRAVGVEHEDVANVAQRTAVEAAAGDGDLP